MINNIIVIIIYIFIGTFFLKLSDRNSYKRRRQYIIAVSAILIFQSGFRNIAVGMDTYAYSLTFNDAEYYTFDYVYQYFVDYFTLGIGKDPGFLLIEKFFHTILFGNFQFFLFIIAIFFFVSLGKFILSNTRQLSDVILAYVVFSSLYFSFYSITGIRQTIAMAIVMFAFPLIKKRKFLWFLFLIMIAYTIHKSAIIILPFYLININKKWSKYILLVTLLTFPLTMIFKSQMLSFIQLFMGYESYNEYEGAGTYTFTFLFIIVSVLAYYKREFIFRKNADASFFYNALAFCLVLLPLSFINPTLLRVIMYFSIYLLVIIPELINSFSNTSKTKIPRDFKVFTTIVLIALFVKSNSSLEYGFFWEEMQINNAYFIRE